MPTLTSPHIRFGASPEPRERLASAVLKSPRLLAAVPESELRPLFTAYERATEAAAAAAKLPTPAASDAVSDVYTRLLAGESIDPAALVKELAEADRTRDDRARVVAVLQSMPGRVADEIVHTVADYEDEYYSALDAAQSDVLDRATVAAADLDGVSNADQAIERGKADAWATFKGLVAEYAATRREHIALLRASGDSRFTGPDGVLHQTRAALPGVDRVVAQFSDISRGEVADLLGRRAALSAPVYDIDSPAHLLWVLANRSQLRPCVARPSEVGAAAVVTAGFTPGDRMDPESRAAMLKRIRNEAATADADERREMAAWGEPA